MARHTNMPVRVQRTPYGEVKLTSRWKADRYYLVATGDNKSLRWLFKAKKTGFERHGNQFRNVFPPSPRPITVARELQKVCSRWQDVWNENLEDFTSPIDDSHGVVTLRDLVEYLKPIRIKDLKPSTYETDCHCLRRWESELDFGQPLSELSYEMLQSAFLRIREVLKPSSANRTLGVLKTYLNWALEEGIIDHSPHRKLKKIKVYKSHRVIKWWEKHEVMVVLDCARSVDAKITAFRNGGEFHTSKLLIALGCFLGLRYEEIIMQRWEDLELDRVNLETGEPAPVCHVVPHSGWEPKDGEARVVPIRMELLEILQECRQEEGYLLVPEKRCRKKGGTKRVYRYDPKKLWLRVLKEAIAVGVPRITPYGMRHTFASNLIAVGVSDIKIAMWLGHSNSDMLHQHYAHLRAFDNDINR